MAAKKKTGKGMMKWDEQLAAHASAETAREVTAGGAFIGTQGGKYAHDGAELPNPLNVVVLGSVFENAYYDGAFDPDNPASPVCFAIADEEDDLKPHDDSTDKQCDTCEECWANEFGSASTGRGKACKNTRRLSLASSDEIAEGVGEDAAVLMLRLPPTSVKGWKGYVNQIGKVKKRPPFGVHTSLLMEPEKTYFVIRPSFISNVSDEHMQAVMDLREMSDGDLHANTYQANDSDDDKPAPRKAPAKKRAAPKRAAPKKKAAAKKKGRKF